MQENNFEKQVQEKTDELRLTPSAEVWKKVAVAIAKSKSDRRVFAIILLLLFTGSVVFVTWQLKSGRKTNPTISEKSDPVKTSNLKNNTSDKNTNDIGGLKNTRKTVSKHAAGDEIKIIKDIPAKSNTDNQQKPATAALPVKKPGPVAAIEPGNDNIDHKGAKDDLDKNIELPHYKTLQKLSISVSNETPLDKGDETNGLNETVKIKVEAINNVIKDAMLKERLSDTVSKTRVDIKDHTGDTLVFVNTGNKNDASVKSSVQSKQNGKWNIGVNFSLGAATTKNGYLGIIGSGGSDELKTYLDANPAAGGNTGQGQYGLHTPSKIKPGAGLVLGVFVQKDISPKTIFLAGLNYKTFSSSMMVGNRVDSNSNLTAYNYFYRSGSSSRYKNHFHFIELPVALRFKLGKQNKVPVYLNTGVSIARLIASDALQFDILSGTYYSDHNLFNKTQVNVSAGLLFSLSGKAKNPFLVGPDISFGLNKMANSGLYGNRHYSYLGIMMQKSIGKR